jgi:GntR family transcriptional regulator, transcriptional repressor for pyruvate dehydrogenase complex
MAQPPEIVGLGTGLSPVERHSTVGAVAKQLLQHLANGSYSPGTRLPPERQLAASLGVGRSTLREALAALDILGLLDVRPGSGTYLAADSSELLPQAIKWSLMLGQPRTRDLVEIREYLEVFTARLAAERASDDDIARLRDTVVAMRDAGDDVDAFVKADLAFHFEAARIAGNTVLQDILHSIRSLLALWFDRTLRVPGTIAETLVEHEAVFDAIATRSPDVAEQRMKALMDAADIRLNRTINAADEALAENEQTTAAG